MVRGDRREPGRLHQRVSDAIFALLVVTVTFCCATEALAFDPRPVPGRMILKLRADVVVDHGVLEKASSQRSGIPTLDALHESFGVLRFAHLFPGTAKLQKLGGDAAQGDLDRFFSVDFAPELDLESVRSAYAALDVVELAEYDWMAPLHLQTNDSSGQWHIQTTTGFDAHVTGGWNHSTGDTSVVLAIADSGVDWMHPDLGGTGPDFVDGNIWVNWAEYHGASGVDDDGNGFVDDVRGWDFLAGFPRESPWPGEDAVSPDNDPMDFNGHGTHVAGIASAITNNGVGVSGVGFSCKVMALRIGGSIVDPGGSGNEVGVVYMSHAASALIYAVNQGARAFNASWGSVRTSALDSAVDVATGAGDMVIVVSAGNDNSSTGSYLSTRLEDDTFSVAATSMSDARAPFSSYGTWVDVSAPGVGILSTYFQHNAVGDGQHTYQSLQGTSMSAPLVTGLVGLVRARIPSLSRVGVEQLIENGCDNIDAQNPGFAGQLGAGRVNALKTFGDYFLTVPEDYPTIQLAMSQSAYGDTIALRGGVVYRANVLVQNDGRLIQGGWDDTYNSRDPGNPAIISSNGATTTLAFVEGVGDETVIDALHLTGGVAKSVTNPNGLYGGGLLVRGASPLFRDCVIEGNSAGSDLEFGGGGGGFFQNSSSVLERCTFESNVARAGGALYVLDSGLRLEDCVFEANTVRQTGDSRGANVFVSGGTFTMHGGRIANGSQAAYGGAIFATAASTVDMQAVELRDNSALRGGAIALEMGSHLALRSSVMNANAASQLGGGVHVLGASADIVNTSFNANSGVGAAIFSQDAPSAWRVRNNIFANHTASVAILVFGSNAVLDYNLYWNNSQGDATGAVLGPNAFAADPLFVDAAAGDLALGAHSPALDSGDPDAQYDDADGTRNDRGAFGGPAARSRAPAVPTDFEARRVDDANEILWTASPDVDVDYYAIYRSAHDPEFAPSPANFVASVPANLTTYSDAAAASSWYRVAAIDESGASSGFTSSAQAVPSTGTGPRDDEDDAPDAVTFRFALRQNVPNPFNPWTRIRFEIPQPASVEVLILDVRGRVVRRLRQVGVAAGPGEVLWNGRDESGREVPSGTYVYWVTSGRWTASRKMTLLR